MTARARRGRQPEHWWARRWIEVLEGFEVGRRLGRGRNYARQGQVIDLEIGKGFVTAKVQGSRDAPYLVRMHFSMFSSTDWKKLVRQILERPEQASRLVAGEIPEDIEAAFRALGLSLFPSANGDLKTACSCPDQANPCKHVAAVYYLLAEEFDRDPFLIFRLRGIERGELIEAIRSTAAAQGTPLPATPREEALRPPAPAEPEPAERGAAPEAIQTRAPAPRPLEAPPRPPPAPRAETARDLRGREAASLASEPHAFWAGSGSTAEDAREVRIPSVPAALPKRLGGFPFWRGEQDASGLIELIYREASAAGLDVFLGSPEAREADERG